MVERPFYVTDAPAYVHQYPQQVTDAKPQCWQCKRVLAAFLTRPWELKCQRCNARNASPTVLPSNIS